MAAMQLRKRMEERRRQVGDELMAETMQNTEAALAEFKSNLERFALQHREAIRGDPDFRAQFHAMCAHIGVDPLASNKSAVSRVLDFKGWSFASFYFALGVTVAEVCRQTRGENGGVIALRELTRRVVARRGHAVERVSPDDVLQAVKKLEVLDKSFKVIPDPKGGLRKGVKYFVSSVPREFDMAFQDVFAAAHGKGFVSLAELAALPGWAEERARLTLSSMVQEGVCMVDDGAPGGGRLFWFPAVFEQPVQ